MSEDELDELDWVIWELEVFDPDELTEPGVGQRTTPVVTEMAGALGCAFVGCCDDDSVDGVPYYSWQVRVPRDEHRRRNDEGVPLAVAALHEHLRTRVPAQLDDWRVHPDRGASFDDEAGRVLRQVYQDLVDPLEVALLGLRRDGAQKLDPYAQRWWGDQETMAGVYTMWLCEDPGSRHLDVRPWLVLYAGLVVGEDFWDSGPGQGLRRFGFAPGSPVLVLPRPAEPLWIVVVTTGPYLAPATAPRPMAVGASHRWTSRDGGELAHRVAADLQALFPHLAG